MTHTTATSGTSTQLRRSPRSDVRTLMQVIATALALGVMTSEVVDGGAADMGTRMRLSAIAAVPLALVVTVACIQTADGAKRPCKPRSCPGPTTPTPTTSTTSTATPTPQPGSPQPVLAYYNRFANGPRYTTTDFPYGVWLQDPSKDSGDVGRQYKALGVNTYVGQWTWPASSYSGHAQAVQNALAANGAQAFGRYSTQALQQVRTLNGDRFRGWLLEDEPDMRGITEEQLSTQAAQAHMGDPSRPTYVNFSKGIVNGWNGSRQLTAAGQARVLHLR